MQVASPHMFKVRRNISCIILSGCSGYSILSSCGRMGVEDSILIMMLMLDPPDQCHPFHGVFVDVAWSVQLEVNCVEN